MVKSRYTLVVENLSSNTRSGDVRKVFDSKCGSVRSCERDYKLRVALVEMDRSGDAEYAWRKMDGYEMDGRQWKVDYADKRDFEDLGWKWTEGGGSISP